MANPASVSALDHRLAGGSTPALHASADGDVPAGVATGWCEVCQQLVAAAVAIDLATGKPNEVQEWHTVPDLVMERTARLASASR